METDRNLANVGRKTNVLGQNLQHFVSNSPWSGDSVILAVENEIKVHPAFQEVMLVLDESAEEKAVSVAEHLSEGNSIKGTARLVRVDPSTVRRLNKRVGRHGQQYHEEKVHSLAIENLQADERYGFVTEKAQPASRRTSGQRE